MVDVAEVRNSEMVCVHLNRILRCRLSVAEILWERERIQISTSVTSVIVNSIFKIATNLMACFAYANDSNYM